MSEDETRTSRDAASHFLTDPSKPEQKPAEELLKRLQDSQMRRPKPSPEAIAAAVQAIQRLGVTADPDDDPLPLTEERTPEQDLSCRFCGHEIRAGNLFCGKCGAPVSDSPVIADSWQRPETALNATHHYHHHYHHHYLPSADAAEALVTGGLPRQSPAAAPAPALGKDLKPRGPLAGATLSRAEAAVRQMTQDWALACNNKQLDDLLVFYAADALVLRPNIPAVRGIAAIREFFFTALDSGLGDIEMEPLRVEVLGDVAYEAGRCQMLVPFAVGKRREERGKYVVVFAKRGNEWKAVVDSWSNDLSLKVTSETEPPKAPTPSTGMPLKPRRP
jgi:ketosteroid isomerase-like protein